jgi:serine/threonine protein kinase/formylglycine-generating enzyme required for sulfatase activity
MGQVFLAQDLLLERLVAIKFIATPRPDSVERELFFKEARAVARLSHPNVVTVYRVGEYLRCPYLVSEYVRGQSLDRMVKPLPPERLHEVAIGLARGLAAAHRRGVLHRDIKPANAVLAEDGTVKLLDFGVAKLLPHTPPPMDGAGAGAEAVGFSGGGLEHEAARMAATPRLDVLSRTATAGGNETPRMAIEGVPATPHASMAPSSAGGEASGLARGGSETGSLVGTPLYMAPEIWRGEPATTRSDVYSLGALLYELACGHPPHHQATRAELPERVQAEEAPSLAEVAPRVDRRLAAIIERALARDPKARFASGDAVRDALEMETPALPAQAGAVPEGNPYRGLAAFEAEHRSLFFGRQAEVRALVERLRGESMVWVVGDSGVGKSSLCRAGVVPAVREGALGWALDVATLRPGRRPVLGLALALAGASGLPPATLEAELMAGSVDTLVRRLQERATGVLLFIDQLEELFTLAAAEEATLWAELLLALITRLSRLRILGTVRSDFLTRFGALPGLGEELTRAIYLLAPLGPAALRDAIVSPAAAKGFHFEPEALVDSLAEAAAHSLGGLPLLQFALAELWERRDRESHRLSEAAFVALGGVGGALARHADAVLGRLLPAERRQARRLLGLLVTPEGTRSRRTVAELGAGAQGPETRAVLDALVQGRLLVTQAAEETGESTYEIAHEALLEGWDTLRGWLAGDAERRALEQRLAQAAAEWERLGRVVEALWSERQLAEASSLDPALLGPRETAFLLAARRAGRRRRYRRWALLMGGPLVILLVYGAVTLAHQFRVTAEVERNLVTAREQVRMVAKQREEAKARRLLAFQKYDHQAPKDGEVQWQEARRLLFETDAAYVQAAKAVEAVLALAPGRADARALLGDILYERILLSELALRGAARDELVARLADYDDDGSRRKRLEAPTELAVASRPAGARVTLWRHDADGRQLRKIAELGMTPTAPRLVGPGSYVLEFGGPGRVDARLPLWVARAESLRIDVTLPAVAEEPAGFVYVPAGRFLFGSGDDDDVRRSFYRTAPLHEVTTESYWIGRTEVTFGDWLAFLRALPAEDRARHTPRAELRNNTVKLNLLPDGRYRLTFRPTSQTFSVVEGELVHYPERTRRAEQDWLRFPVVGISFEDAEAYARWLAETGRVPGARLCTEYEWERAARGADGRRFPSGGRLEPDDANIDITYGRRTLAFGPDEVGSHAGARSPVGTDDMAGNVWEWTRSYSREGEPVLRGGTWYQGELTARSMNREVSEVGERDARVGLRLCATPVER